MTDHDTPAPGEPLPDEPGRHAADERSPSLLELWRSTSPVRVALYPVLAAVGALLVGYGLLTDQQLGLWLAVVAAVLGLGTLGTELGRRLAWSPATVRRTVDEWREHEYAEGYHDARELTLREVTERAPRLSDAEVQQAQAHPRTEAIEAQGRGRPPVT